MFTAFPIILHKITAFYLDIRGSQIVEYYIRDKAMGIKWKQLILCLLIWVITEILFNYMGIDDFADYSEFIFERYQIVKNFQVCIIIYS